LVGSNVSDETANAILKVSFTYKAALNLFSARSTDMHSARLLVPELELRQMEVTAA